MDLDPQIHSQNSRNQCFFSFYFCFMIEGSGSGSIPLTNKSVFGSRRLKNMLTLWIRIRIDIFFKFISTYSIRGSGSRSDLELYNFAFWWIFWRVRIRVRVSFEHKIFESGFGNPNLYPFALFVVQFTDPDYVLILNYTNFAFWWVFWQTLIRLLEF